MRLKVIFVFLALPIMQLSAQSESDPKPKKEIKELKLLLNQDGSHFIQAAFLNQAWVRFNESNPGTTVLGDPRPQTFDVGLRRTRFQLFGQLTDHVRFYFQLGQNNFNYLAGQNSTNSGNRKFQFFVHDARAEYQVKKKSDILFIGAGLGIANGLSRFSSPSVSAVMSLDVPVFAQATVDQTDLFSRKLSLYATGQISKLDYRIIMSDPFPVTSSGTLPAIELHNANFAYDQHHKQWQGFFKWNFFEKDPSNYQFCTGTFLGQKKILNLEAGFITQKNATWTGASPADVNRQYYNMNLWSAALFYDSPLNKEKGTAFNAYLGYFGTDYGKGYLRYNGAMNPATGSQFGLPNIPTGSFGNAFPMFGTGNVIYSQAGYLMRRNLLGEHGTLMPYVTLQSARYERLDKASNVYDLGLNWLLNGHSSKITLDWQLRPSYSGTNNLLVRNDGMSSQVTVQYQVSF